MKLTFTKKTNGKISVDNWSEFQKHLISSEDYDGLVRLVKKSFITNLFSKFTTTRDCIMYAVIPNSKGSFIIKRVYAVQNSKTNEIMLIFESEVSRIGERMYIENNDVLFTTWIEAEKHMLGLTHTFDVDESAEILKEKFGTLGKLFGTFISELMNQNDSEDKDPETEEELEDMLDGLRENFTDYTKNNTFTDDGGDSVSSEEDSPENYLADLKAELAKLQKERKALLSKNSEIMNQLKVMKKRIAAVEEEIATFETTVD